MPALEEAAPDLLAPAPVEADWDAVQVAIDRLGGPTAFATLKVANDGRNELDWDVWFGDGTRFDIPSSLVAKDIEAAARLVIERHREAVAH